MEVPIEWVWLLYKHILGIKNIAADCLSRIYSIENVSNNTYDLDKIFNWQNEDKDTQINVENGKLILEHFGNSKIY